MKFMAQSPYRCEDYPVYRRSISFSNLMSNGFLFEEVVTLNGKQYLKSFSHSRIFMKSESGETFRSMRIQTSNLIMPLESKISGDKRKCLSMPEKLAIDCDDEKGEVKAKKCLAFSNREDELRVETKKKSRKLLRKSIYLNIIILILLAKYLYSYNHCSQEWNIEKLSDELNHSVFGQNSAILKIENVLKRFNYSRENTMMSFIGSGGVGKTFVSAIIFNNFPWEDNKFVHYYDSNLGKTLLDKTYPYCGCKLIIIDGMNVQSVESVSKIIEKLNSNNQNMLVILIFKTHNKNEEDFILNNLDESFIRNYHILFDDLKIEHVKKCFEVELKRQGLNISNDYLNDVIMKKVLPDFPGCKKVLDQVSLIPKMK